MIFKNIFIKEGIYERKIEFTNGVNLIYSQRNSRGKTTLLRLMLYGLGYDIPSTRKLKFDKCYIELEAEFENLGQVKLIRNKKELIEVIINGEIQTYVLPSEQKKLHALLYNSYNDDILSNLLGVYYVDQEKGWTLLNRGIVIGSIRFNIESLVRGLSGIDCNDLIRKEKKISNDLQKYKQMHSVAEYRKSIQIEENSMIIDSYEDTVINELDKLLIQQREIKKELRRIESTISDNKKFKKFIEDMKLLVTTPNGEEIMVTEKNISGLEDLSELLKTKKLHIASMYSDICRKIEKIQEERTRENEQLKFFEENSIIKIFDKEILRMQLNQIAIDKQISMLGKQKAKLRKKIQGLTKEDNEYILSISNVIENYAKELELEDIPKGYLFTSNLKELTGAVLHKFAFIFRLGYILAIENKLNIKLPIILDSPSGKEIDKENIRVMTNILKRDFPNNQIIIASIFEYNFDKVNKIEIKDFLLENI
ncbi:MAG: hypothetical protein HXM18_05525 [Gemella morbillorum]|uniref:hypothetical protein n=1 Tax=Gemella morbillorum TaxID=29391 RepID=UPI001CB199FC|nr:hypothetical protein [Gemella morbillorum]MBF1209978.1 hypothetical protein [Gemella morbillorum]